MGTEQIHPSKHYGENEFIFTVLNIDFMFFFFHIFYILFYHKELGKDKTIYTFTKKKNVKIGSIIQLIAA